MISRTFVENNVKTFASRLGEVHQFMSPFGGRPIPAERTLDAIKLSAGCLSAAVDCADAINRYAVLGSERDISVGRELLPVAAQDLAVFGRNTDDIKDFLSLYKRLYAGVPLEMPDWFSSMSPYLHFCVEATRLPEKKLYLSNSPAFGPRIQELDSVEDDNSYMSDDPDDPHPLMIYSADDNIIEEMFREVNDIDLRDIPELVNNLSLRTVLGQDVFTPYVYLFADMNQALLDSIRADENSRTAQPFSIPFINMAGGADINGTEPFTLKDDSFPEFLGYHTGIIRSFERLFDCAIGFPKGMVGVGFLDLIAQPLGSISLYSQLAASERFRQCRPLLADTLMGPAVSFGSEGAVVTHPYADPADGRKIMKEAVIRYMTAPADELYAVEENLKADNDFACLVFPMLAEARELLDNRNYSGLANLINTRMAKLKSDGAEPRETAGFVYLLSSLAGDAVIARMLKNRVNDISDVRMIVEKITDERARNNLQAEIPSVIKGMNINLNDFFGNEDFVRQVRDYVEDFLLFNSRPDALDGRSPHEVFDNGFLLYGAPGVGKTYFVDCLAHEYGLPVIKVAYEDFLDGSGTARELDIKSIIDGIQGKVKEAINASVNPDGSVNPVVLFFDEFEELVSERKDPAVDSQDKRLTATMLRIIGKLRRENPGVLVIAATNYLESIDEAMKYRDGRFDVRMAVPLPDKTSREALINETVREESSNFRLSADEMDELVKISGGLMPGSIKKAVIYVFRKKAALNDESPVTFSDIKTSMQRKAETMKDPVSSEVENGTI